MQMIMIDVIIDLSKIIGAAGTILLTMFAIASWLRPIRVVADATWSFDGSGPNEIVATVVNKSKRAI